MRYILYARKSTEEKTKQVQSIDDQITALAPIIAERGLLVTHYLKESRSAKDPGRPGFNQMLSLLDKGEADAILCWHLNRLSRNEIDSGTVRWMLRQGKIREIVTPIRTYTPDDNALITAVEAAMSEQFIVELKQSSRRGMLSKVEKGWFPGFVPLGYKNDIVSHTIVRDPETWDWVYWSWREMLTGKWSLPALSQEIDRRWGAKGRREGRRVSVSTLHRIFTTQFYYGVFRFENELHPGKHEPMVTAQEFDYVQKRLGRHPQKRRRTHRFAYTGLIRCGHCGKAVTCDEKRKVRKDGEEVRYRYYVCAQMGRCQPVWVPERIIDDCIAEQLAAIAVPEVAWQVARDAMANEEELEKMEAGKAQEARQRSFEDLDRQMETLLSLRLGGLIDDGEFSKRREVLRQEREGRVMANTQGNISLAESRQSLLNVARFCYEAPLRYRGGELEVRMEIARRLGTYCLTGGDLQVTLHPALAKVREIAKETSFEKRFLEPLDIGSGSGPGGANGLSKGRWGDSWNVIRTFVTRDIFPGFSF